MMAKKNFAIGAKNWRTMKMPEFNEVMKRWREMCSSRTNSHCGYACAGCPLEHNPVCGELEIATDKEIEEAKNSILNWRDDEE